MSTAGYGTEHPCANGKCAAGVCHASGSYEGCGGCCGCLGGCFTDYEISCGVDQGAPPPPYPPQTKYGTWQS